MSTNLPSGTVTFLFTDLEGSTKLWEQYPGAMKRALTRHDDIVRESIEGQAGRVIKNTGDGFHAVFETGVSGVNAALAAQRTLSGTDWDEIAPPGLRVRMALHTGEAQERGGDFYGPALNRAARLMSIAHGGQVLLSTTTAHLVRDQLPGPVSLRDLGEHRLRDLVRSEHVFQLVDPALPVDFPPIKSIDAFPNNLPVQLTSFIGRERELAEARQRFESARLLTLIGPGGTGKTRLSLQLGADLLPSFPDGVWLAELAPLTDPALVMQSVASVFHLREQLGMPIDELLIDYLREKELVLILDNCEHLIESCAQLADQILHASACLKIIASSREALGISGETVYRVPPLSLPEAESLSRASVVQCESAQLFMERAGAANPKFAVTEQNAGSIAQICRRLDGIPLGIELAAARVTAFSAEQIASHLDDRFRLLTGGSRTALPRQQTLRALIDWSYDLLSEDERSLLRKLSVFASGWTFEAAEMVCSSLDVLNLLVQLVNKSLVTMDDEPAEPRYHLLETVRQYARDKLLETGESEATRGSHFDHFYALAGEAAPRLRSFGASEWVDRLDREHGNLRAAAQWALENRLEDLFQLTQFLLYFWNRRGYEEEGRNLIREALRRAEQLPEFQGSTDPRRLLLLGEAWQTLIMLAYSQGDNIRAIEASEHAAAIARQLDNKRLLALALAFETSGLVLLGRLEEVNEKLEEGLAAADESGDPAAMGLPMSLFAQAIGATTGDFEAAQARVKRGQDLLARSGDDWGATMGLMATAMVAKARHDYTDARRQFLSVEPFFRDLGDQHRINMVHSELAHIERYEGQYDRAEAMYRGTIKEWQRIGHRAAVAHQLECFALLAQLKADDQRAARLYGAAEALRDRIGIPMTQAERVEYEQHIAELQRGTDAPALTAAWAEGRQWSMDQAVRRAVEGSGNGSK
ncbi:MAG TPA: adenylate/guanylate cyclase domain-containing protein [Anaerolineales bacterium]|nr:adenylate/guanylate cyclase domain-containing protein [Anaerolineales bacterium]